MPLVGTIIFGDSEEYKSNFRGAKVELVFTGRSDFAARLTAVELPNLHILRSQERQPRIAYLSLAPKRVFISFATRFDAPPICDGVELQPGDIVLHSIGECVHQRTKGACEWTFVSLLPASLAKFGKVFTGTNLAAPPAGRVLRPPAIAATYLRRLLAKAGRVADTQPDVIAHRECARSLEQQLIPALIKCLTSVDAPDHVATRRHHSRIMARFESVLTAHPDQQLRMGQLCKVVGVPERTLRICSAEILGMGPSAYIRLRRLNLVRAALSHRGVALPSIAKIAARYGFADPGRFAVTYRSVFGETPSSTLRRSAFIG